jgi:hypothetical protein
MNIFNKAHLLYKDYDWKTYDDDDPKVTGFPDNTLFNRHQGFEILYLINKLMEEWKFKNIASGQHMEKLIREYLPSDIRSQLHVKEWLKKNWEIHK